MQIITEAALPLAVPVSYVGFFEHMTDPLKLAGFVVMVLQGIYICCKIYGEWRKTKRDEQSK